MIPLDTELVTIRTRQRELWREADAFRRGREARAHAPRWTGRAFSAVGGWLIAWGAWLQHLAAHMNTPSRPAAAHGSSL